MDLSRPDLFNQHARDAPSVCLGLARGRGPDGGPDGVMMPLVRGWAGGFCIGDRRCPAGNM